MSEPSKAPAKRSRKHKKKHYILRLLILAGIVAALIGTACLPYFHIQQIAVIGNRAVSDEEVVELSQLQTGKSIFAINPFLTKSRIKKNLYIEKVNIDLHLPSTVDLIVKERESTAQFVKKDKKGKKTYVVTDADGMVLGTSDKKKNVTVVREVTVLSCVPGEKIKVKETGVYTKGMELIRVTAAGDLYFKRIIISGSRVEAYIYDKLIVKGRYKNLVHSIESGELKSVVYRLYQQDIEKGTINIGDNNYCSFTPEN